MPVFVCLKCQRRISAKDELAGQLVICPSCETRQKVPIGAATVDEVFRLRDAVEDAAPPPAIAVAELGACPQCQQPALPNAHICTICGLDFRTGKQLTVTTERSKVVVDVREYQRLKKRGLIGPDGRPRSVPEESGLGAVAILILMFAVAGGAAAWWFLLRDRGDAPPAATSAPATTGSQRPPIAAPRDAKAPAPKPPAPAPPATAPKAAPPASGPPTTGPPTTGQGR